MQHPSTESPTHSGSGSLEVGTEPVFVRLKDAIESTREWASKLNEEILTPNLRALVAAAHPNPQVAIAIVAPFLLSTIFAAAFVVLTFLGVIGFALVAITASVALVLIGALMSVAIKILVVTSAGVVATVVSSDAWRSRALQNVLKRPRSTIIATTSALGALLLRKPGGKLLRKLFRAKNNDVVFYPTTRPHGIPKPPICRGPHQRWPQHTAPRPNPAWPWQKLVKPGSISQSPSQIIGGRQHMSISSFLMKVIGKVFRILIHIGLYIVHLLQRAIIRVIDHSIRRILRLIRHIGFSGFILISLVVYVFVLHYKLRGSKKAGNKGKDRRREDIRE